MPEDFPLMRPLRRLGARGRSGPPFFRRPVARLSCRRRLLLCLLFAKPYFRWPTAAGFHLFPFRTEKLSPPAPMVLRQRESRSPPFFSWSPPHNAAGDFFLCPAAGQSAGRTLPGRCRGRKQSEMDADHVTAWSKGGVTSIENCQMLCKTHNRAKGNK